MKTLIVHIEFSGVPLEHVKDRVSSVLEDIRDGIKDRNLGWRFFGSVEDADRWETGKELGWNDDLDGCDCNVAGNSDDA